MIRLRHLAEINPATPQFDRIPDDKELPFAPLEAVWPGGVDLSRSKLKSEASTGYTRFLEGDILVPKITPTFEANRSTIASDVPGGVAAGTTELHVVRVGEGADVRFIRYLLSSKYFLSFGEASMVGVAGQKRIPDQLLRDLPVQITDLAEQRAIADYLDRETARIDALIAAKRQMIELLQQRFDVWCSEALNATEEAGLRREGPWPWLLLKHVASVHGGLTLGQRYEGPVRNYPYLRVANVQDRRLDLSEVSSVDVPEAVAARFRVVAGDVLMLEGNGNPENLGRGTIWHGEIAECLHQNHVHVVRADRRRLLPDFLDRLVRTRWARWNFTSASAQVSIATLSQKQIAALPISLPPLDIQEHLVKRIAIEADRDERLRWTLEQQLGLLEQRREAVVTNGVTGGLPIPVVVA